MADLGSRPETTGPPQLFYNATEARKYQGNSRMVNIQTKLSERALELLNLPDDGHARLLLDIGCGTALSGEVLEEHGHYWLGMDISRDMLGIARERELEGDLVQADMGEGVPFRPGVFDGAVSVSALQWLCNADTKEQVPQKRLRVFFDSLYASLAIGTRAVFQFYPANADQIKLISQTAMRSGFTSRLVVDYPNSTKAKKFFLCLYCGPQPIPQKIDGLQGEEQPSDGMTRRKKRALQRERGGKGKRNAVKSRDWVKAKKERQKKQGKEVRP
eukprot:CAMPEP_0119134672 /NCGR_PEP_ID=MMETSP1310-20130426/17522_1 /TAXON_ID=464262 /ORGANISM="Genus nov. species nov., Strain RCC2339" /LENGTH=272 /DNA_ID=CAMNT_0007125493 /DNA_START=147 /DNA_END=961 /DNA_ORIENTATION=+